MAPLLEAAADAVVLFEEDVVDAAATLADEDAADVVAAIEPVVEPPMGAVDCPAISADTEELKVPVIDAMLNSAENAISGYALVVLSVSVRDWIRMKLRKKGRKAST